jgi:hypothetical protein
MKKLLPVFGLLDIITLIRSYKHIIPTTMDWTYFPLMAVGSTLLYIALFFSAYFLITQKKAGLWLTYAQFPLRLAFGILSFGFLFSANHLFNNPAFLFWILVGLEALRLIFTIAIHKKYF